LNWYVDSSAILSIIYQEPEGKNIPSKVWVGSITSRLSGVEVLRSVNKFDPLLVNYAKTVMEQISVCEIEEDILRRAESYGSEITVKASDAIHLATTEALSSLIKGIITLDKQMAKNADRLGLEVFSNS
jgi:predicted nucleic acid-binding protein